MHRVWLLDVKKGYCNPLKNAFKIDRSAMHVRTLHVAVLPANFSRKNPTIFTLCIFCMYLLWRIEDVDVDVKRGIKIAMSVPRQNAVIASFRSLSIHQKQVGTFGANPSFRGHLRQPPLVLDLRRIPWGIEANVQGFTFYHSVRRIAFWRIESWFIWKYLIFFLNFDASFLICQLLFRPPFAYFESVKIGLTIFLQCYQLYRKFNILKGLDKIL